MNKETNQIIESFQNKSNDIINLLFKLQKMIGSSISLINSSNDSKELSNLLCELNTFMLNDDLITLVKDQQYELIALNDKYLTATDEIAHLEEEREALSEKIQILLQKQRDLNNENDTIQNTVSLSDYNNLKEEYLQLYSRNQLHEQKYEEYQSIINSYQQSKENLYLLTYSYEGLKQEHESKYIELNERLTSLIEENTELKKQKQENLNHCSLHEMDKHHANNKINTLNRKHRVTLFKIKTMEKGNSLLKISNLNLKAKLVKCKEENEEMKSQLQKLEENHINLINKKNEMGKNFLKELFEQFENKNISFHYIPTGNMIAIYFEDERIGEVRNKTLNFIKRNQSNKLVLKYQYLLADHLDHGDVDDLLTQKKEKKFSVNLDENTLQHLNSNDDSLSQRKCSNLSKNHLNLLSWDYDNNLIFANKDFCKLERSNSNLYHMNGLSSLTTDLIPNKTEQDGESRNNNKAEDEDEDDDESNIDVSDVEYINNDKEERSIRTSKTEERENNLPKNRIEINNITTLLPLSHKSKKLKQHDKYYSKNYFDVNNTLIEEEHIKQVISQDNKKENKCFYCIIY